MRDEAIAPGSTKRRALASLEFLPRFLPEAPIFREQPHNSRKYTRIQLALTQPVVKT